jgi:transposase
MSNCTDVTTGTGTPRLKRPQRDQIEFRACCWNDLLPEDHQARIVWAYVKRLDLSGWYKRIRAVERGPGPSAIDPRILFALWLYATLRGIGSARELARRCDSQLGEVAFLWICGGVSVNSIALRDSRKKGVRSNLCEAPSGPFRQIGPDPLFPPQIVKVHLAHAGRFPYGAGGTSGPDADPQRGGADAARPGDAGPRGPGRREGACQCRGGFVPPPGHARSASGPSQSTDRCVEGRTGGSPKVKAVILWYLLAHNLMRAVVLRAEQAIEMS